MGFKRLTPQVSSSLRNFFAELLKSTTPKRTTIYKRKRLTGCGESLTSEEAIEKVERAREENEQKENEKKKLKQNVREKKRNKKKRKLNQTKKMNKLSLSLSHL